MEAEPYDAPDQERLYPVVIELREKHVVWVEASNPESARWMVDGEFWEYLDAPTTLASVDSRVSTPDRYDLEFDVYASGENYDPWMGPLLPDKSRTLREYQLHEKWRKKREAGREQPETPSG